MPEWYLRKNSFLRSLVTPAKNAQELQSVLALCI